MPRKKKEAAQLPLNQLLMESEMPTVIDDTLPQVPKHLSVDVSDVVEVELELGMRVEIGTNVGIPYKGVVTYISNNFLVVKETKFSSAGVLVGVSTITRYTLLGRDESVTEEDIWLIENRVYEALLSGSKEIIRGRVVRVGLDALVMDVSGTRVIIPYDNLAMVR